jgi:arginyl-tRNA synthetase
LIADALRSFGDASIDDDLFDAIVIERPSDPAFGDIYTNAAMFFAKKLRIAPKVLAGAISAALEQSALVDKVVVVDPGFINIDMKNEFWRGVISEILEKREKFGETNIGNGERINIEFVSANPTGPLHTGHARNAVFGSVASNLFEKIGYSVTREFYVNDQGNQIKFLAKSLYLRYLEVLGPEISENDFEADMYCGEYVKDLARQLYEVYQDRFIEQDESENIEELGNFAVKRMVDNIKSDLKSIGVVMDGYTSEAEICRQNLVEDALNILSARGDIYEGVLPRPKGIAEDDEWEERPQTLFKSTRYGDSIDRAIRKSDGTWTYFAGDIAYHLDKIRRGYKRMVAVLGADHGGYLKRLKAVVSSLSDGSADIEIRLYQLVNFLEKGKPVRMSKRSGNFIKLRDVVDRVGKDVTRYMMISRHHDVMIDFDFGKAIECSMENPLFYIQYAYARICSVFRHSEEIFGEIAENELKNCKDLSCLSDPTEITMMKVLSFWPERVKAAALTIEPHRIPNCLQEVAQAFHSLWNAGKQNAELRFVSSDNKSETSARLSLLLATKLVLEDGLHIMGITPISEMR